MKQILNYQSQIKPTWCPGCGNFGIMTALNNCFNQLRLKKEEIVIVTDVGCAGNSADFYSTYVFHAVHGRSLPPAAGIKLANHKLTVIAITGDGGLFGEGTTHLMNLIRGNHDITVLHHNNYRYSLTTGQAAPTTPKGTITPSTPEGLIEMPINPIEFVLACQPTFAARGYSYKIDHLANLITKAILHKGFSFVDIIQPCVNFNKDQNLAWYNNAITQFDGPLPLEVARKKALVDDKISIGLFYQASRPAYHQEISTLKNSTLCELAKTEVDISNLLEQYK